jgi:ATP-dependent DNA helicase 2 subunit 2
MPIEDTYSPLVHRINQAIRRRAVQPDEAVTSPADILIKYSVPPPELVSESASELNKLVAAADVKKGKSLLQSISFSTDSPPIVPPKAKGKRGRREITKPLSGLDVESLLGREKRRKLSLTNAIPGFKQMLESADDVKLIPEAAKQMGDIIHELIRTSLGDQWYAQALENLSVMREQMIEFEEPGTYNEFIHDLKNRLLHDGLGGGRKDLWFAIIRERKLGLIDSATAAASEVSEAEAAEVCGDFLSPIYYAELMRTVLFYEIEDGPTESC